MSENRQIHANLYSGESHLRGQVEEVLHEEGFEVVKYGIVDDKKGTRTVTIQASKLLGETQTFLKFNTDAGQHPDNV